MYTCTLLNKYAAEIKTIYKNRSKITLKRSVKNKKKLALYKTIKFSKKRFLRLSILNYWMHCNIIHKYFLFIFQMEKKICKDISEGKISLLYINVKLLPKAVSVLKWKKIILEIKKKPCSNKSITCYILHLFTK